MDHCMKEVLVGTTPKDSFTLVVSDNSANIQTTFKILEHVVKELTREILAVLVNKDL